ncbi:MAG: MOSC domain-containing protein [Bacillota bacterium]|nr:MOSC domain-containing protein [Bacillota bacterium]MDP4169694.1 MOSC domain-containing protein [Bacillota bacterium]
MNKAKIVNLAIGKPKEYKWNNSLEQSAIGKTSVEKLIVKKAEINGDNVANLEFHGGMDRVICLYPAEHYEQWEQEFNTSLSIPAFGENITASGMKEEEICIGDIFKIGDAIVQVTQGRIPCSTISKYNHIDLFLKRVYESCLTGYFFRVIEEGCISSDSTIELMERHSKGVTVLKATQVLFHDSKNETAIKEILEVNELADVWKKQFLKALK